MKFATQWLVAKAQQYMQLYAVQFLHGFVAPREIHPSENKGKFE